MSRRLTFSRKYRFTPNAKHFNATSKKKQHANTKSTRFKLRSKVSSIPGRSSAITTQETPINRKKKRSKAGCFTTSYANSRHL